MIALIFIVVWLVVALVLSYKLAAVAHEDDLPLVITSAALWPITFMAFFSYGLHNPTSEGRKQ